MDYTRNNDKSRGQKLFLPSEEEKEWVARNR
jgi:hypothetical protein